MESLVKQMGDALRAFDQATKGENFGGVPDDYREMIEELLTGTGPCAMAVMKQGDAAKEFNEFVQSIRDLKIGHEQILEKTEDQEIHALTIKADDLDLPAIIRKNWSFFEPLFFYFYLGLKVGRKQEREEGNVLKSIAQADEKPSARTFDGQEKQDKAKPQILLPASSDSDLPAISPQTAEKFRREFEAELEAEREKKGESDKAA